MRNLYFFQLVIMLTCGCVTTVSDEHFVQCEQKCATSGSGFAVKAGIHWNKVKCCECEDGTIIFLNEPKADDGAYPASSIPDFRDY